MIFKKNRRISVLLAVLILFFSPPAVLFPLVQTESIYTIPDGGVEILLGDGMQLGTEKFNEMKIGVGLGILTDLSMWFHFSYLTHNTANPAKGAIGDGLFRLKYYMGDYARRTLHLVLLASWRIPAGNNAYHSSEWKTATFGNNEMTVGIAGRYDLMPSWFVHSMITYTFRQEHGENFYGGFNLNPTESETYKSLLGLNPFVDGSFLYYSRLRNDYITMTAGISSDKWYPVIPACELRWSTTIARGGVTRYPITPYGIDPLVFSADVRYFFNRRFYAGCYCAVNVLPGNDGTIVLPGFSCGFEF